mmetsp:Transcript_9106/g.37554  ORF Transcript_9106/g.37554 Transcript_9106/m.37554 type:complete len:714 (+) Transcript_9106:29-2170(+)
MSLLLEIGRAAAVDGVGSRLRLPSESREIEEVIRDATVDEQVQEEGSDAVAKRLEEERRQRSGSVVEDCRGWETLVRSVGVAENWTEIWEEDVERTLLLKVTEGKEDREGESSVTAPLLSGGVTEVGKKRESERLGWDRVDGREAHALAREVTLSSLRQLWGTGRDTVDGVRRFLTAVYGKDRSGAMEEETYDCWRVGVLCGALDAMDSVLAALSGELTARNGEGDFKWLRNESWSSAVTQRELKELMEMSVSSAREQELNGRAGNLRETVGRIFGLFRALAETTATAVMDMKERLKSDSYHSLSEPSLSILSVVTSGEERDRITRELWESALRMLVDCCARITLVKGVFAAPEAHADAAFLPPAFCKPWHSRPLYDAAVTVHEKLRAVVNDDERGQLGACVAWISAQVGHSTAGETEHTVTSWPTTSPSLPHTLHHVIMTSDLSKATEGEVRQLVALALQLLDDWREQSKALAADCLRRVFASSSPPRDLAQAVLEQVAPCNTFRELPFLQRLYSFLLELAEAIATDVTATLLLEDDPPIRLLLIAVDELERSCTADFRKVFANFASHAVRLAGIQTMPYFGRLVMALGACLRWPDEQLVKHGLSCMQELLQSCWPRAHVHAEAVFRLLSEAAGDLFLNFSNSPSEDLKESLEETALLLKSACAAAGKLSHFNLVMKKYTVLGGHPAMAERAGAEARAYWAACITTLEDDRQ